MITPEPRSIIEGRSPRSRRTAGNRFSLMACCQSSSVTIAKPPLGADEPPTLWTMISIPACGDDDGSVSLQKAIGDSLARAPRAPGHEDALAFEFTRVQELI